MRRSPLWTVPALAVAVAAQAAPAGETVPAGSWTARTAYAYSLVREWERVAHLRAATDDLRDVADAHELSLCDHGYNTAVGSPSDPVPLPPIARGTPRERRYGAYVFPTDPLVRPRISFYLAPGAALLRNDDDDTRYPMAPPDPLALLRGDRGAADLGAANGHTRGAWRASGTIATSALDVLVTDGDGAPLAGACVRLAPASSALGELARTGVPLGVPLDEAAPAGRAFAGDDGRATIDGVVVRGLTVRVALAGVHLDTAKATVARRGGTLHVTLRDAAQPPRQQLENERMARVRAEHVERAQGNCRSAVAVDADRDGVGEFTFLRELTERAPVRRDADGRAGTLPPEPPFLSLGWGRLRETRLEQHGYLVQVFLRARDRSWVCEPPREGGGAAVDPDEAEQRWCAFAWPARAGWTGRSAFFVDQGGVVLEHANADGAMSGATAPRPWSSATPPAGWTPSDRSRLRGR